MARVCKSSPGILTCNSIFMQSSGWMPSMIQFGCGGPLRVRRSKSCGGFLKRMQIAELFSAMRLPVRR